MKYSLKDAPETYGNLVDLGLQSIGTYKLYNSNKLNLYLVKAIKNIASYWVHIFDLVRRQLNASKYYRVDRIKLFKTLSGYVKRELNVKKHDYPYEIEKYWSGREIVHHWIQHHGMYHIKSELEYLVYQYIVKVNDKFKDYKFANKYKKIGFHHKNIRAKIKDLIGVWFVKYATKLSIKELMSYSSYQYDITDLEEITTDNNYNSYLVSSYLEDNESIPKKMKIGDEEWTLQKHYYVTKKPLLIKKLCKNECAKGQLQLLSV